MQTRTALIAAAFITGLALIADVTTAEPFPAGIYNEFGWRMIGPFRGGRTRAVAGVAGQPTIFYAGAVNGGVWKSDDAGRSWRPIFDGQTTQSSGAIAVAPSDPNVIYVGSGEGLYRPDLSVGNGIYRSADAGGSWVHLGLDDAQQIPELAVDPRDPNRLFAAVLGHPYGPSAERGLYRSSDGGRSWQQVLYKDPHTGANAVRIDPLHPDVVYAALWEGRLGPWEDRNVYNGAGGGLYKSSDGGSSWRAITAGLPAKLTQLNIAIAPSRPERLYAVIATTERGEYGSAVGLGLYRSDDAGESWSRITDDPRPVLRIGGGDLATVTVDPTNPDIVYTASIVTMKSVDGGRTWSTLRGAPGGDDYQNLWINPRDPQVIALVGDQGAIVTVNGGRSWSSWFNQPTAQLYHIGITPTFPYRVCSGQQESGSVCVASRGNYGEITAQDWRPVGVIEYGYAAPDPLDPDLIYGAGRNEVSKYHWSTGQVENVTPIPVRGKSDRVDRTEPLLFSPVDPHTLYYAANVLYRTTDGGSNWQVISPDLARPAGSVPSGVGDRRVAGAERQRGVIYAVGASALSGDTLWAGTDDGLVWLTQDGGRQWKDVTPPPLTPWSKVTQIEPSHFDRGSAYCSVSRFRVDDRRPYIYRTHDGGTTWQDVGAGLPTDSPVNAVREDPLRQGLLYAATENAVWLSFDDGEHWESLQRNLPHTSMRDLWVQDADLIVATHGRSFWILDDVSRLRQITATGLNDALLVQPAPAYRAPRSTWPDTPIPPDEPLAANPPAGAIIDFYLPRDAKQPTVLEILDAGGRLVRRYSSDDPPEPTAAELTAQLIPAYWVAAPRSLPRTAGMHRWVWDLHYAAPLAVTRGYPISAVPHATPRGPEGPLALPGSYAVRLTVDGHRLEAHLQLRPDPRLRLAAGALEDQFRLAERLAGLLSDSSRALLALRSVHAQLTPLTAHAAVSNSVRSAGTRVAALLEKPETAVDDDAAKPLLPAVQGHLGELYAIVTRGDGAPTAAQLRATEAAASELRGLLDAWQQLRAELPALNARLRAAGLKEIRPELPAPKDLNAADED